MIERSRVALGELADPSAGSISIGPFGSAMKADTYTDSGLRVIRGTNISDTRSWKNDWVHIPESLADRMKRCVAHPGELVFPHRGSIGEVAIVPQDGLHKYFLSSSLMKIKIDESKADPMFIYYFFRSREGKNEILRFGSQVGTPGIGQPLSSLKQFQLPLPELPEQKIIGSLLSLLDDKIDTNRSTNETLDAMARSIFKDWFIDFGPSRAKSKQLPPYLVADAWALFPANFDESGKPLGWSERRVEDILELSYGKALKATERVTGSVPVYGSGGLTGYHNEALVDGPSIIVGRKGTVGTLYWEDTPFFPIDTVFYVKPKAPLSFCYYHLQTLGLDAMNTDAAVPGLNRNNVYRLSVPWSSLEIRRLFDEVVTPLRQKITQNVRQSDTLAAARDFLLPRLISGEIHMRDAEKQIGELV